MGSFVPAERADIAICDQLFAILTTEDSIEDNASTFQMQVQLTLFNWCRKLCFSSIFFKIHWIFSKTLECSNVLNIHGFAWVNL